MSRQLRECTQAHAAGLSGAQVRVLIQTPAGGERERVPGAGVVLDEVSQTETDISGGDNWLSDRVFHGCCVVFLSEGRERVRICQVCVKRSRSRGGQRERLKLCALKHMKGFQNTAQESAAEYKFSPSPHLSLAAHSN